MGFNTTRLRQKLGVKMSPASRIYDTKSKATSDSLSDLIATLQPKPNRPGRFVKAKDGSKTSADIRDAILTFPKYKIHEAASGAVAAACLTLSRRKVENIAHQHRDLAH